MVAMTCRELTERLLDYHCVGIDPARQRAVEAHLMVCDRCLRYLGDYQATVRVVQSAIAGPGCG
jgi:anti-sigma factor RsiW